MPEILLSVIIGRATELGQVEILSRFDLSHDPIRQAHPVDEIRHPFRLGRRQALELVVSVFFGDFPALLLNDAARHYQYGCSDPGAPEF